MDQRADAHQARLDGDVDGGAGEAIVAEPCSRAQDRGPPRAPSDRVAPIGWLKPRATIAPSITSTAPIGTSPAASASRACVERRRHQHFVREQRGSL